MKSKVLLLFAILFLIGFGFILSHYYSYIFSRTVKGRVIAIDRVTQPSAVFSSGNQIPTAQIFSFAVAIRDVNGEILTASSEDRQWAVVEKNQCAEAKYFPYPPWELQKSGTYYGARLLRLYDCPNQ